MSFIRELDKAKELLEGLIKKDISAKGLVDTGTLLNSIEVTIKGDERGFSFEVKAEDYYESLDEEFNITADVVKSSEFNEVKSLISSAYEKLIKDKFK